MPYLNIAKRGFTSKFDLLSIVMAILFKLKSGCQWEHQPVCHFFEGEMPSYKTVFYHYRKWCKIGEWEKMYSRVVRKYRHLVDFSITLMPALTSGLFDRRLTNMESSLMSVRILEMESLLKSTSLIK